MGGFVRAVRMSLRSLARSPGFTLPALLILAIGMTAATAIFTVVDSIVFRPLPLPESRQLVFLCEDHPRMQGACVATPGNVHDLRAASSLSDLGFARTWQFSLSDDIGTRGVSGGLASPSFFRALGVQPVAGRVFTEDEVGPDNNKVVLLGHALWAQRYGSDPGVVGTTIRLDATPYTIVGVLPPDLRLPLDLDIPQLWTPPYFAPLDPEVRGWRGFRAIGRLSPGATVASASTELSGLYRAIGKEHEEVNDEWRLEVRPVLDVVVGGSRPILLAFLGAAGLLLLIVCANVANLLLARGLGRRRELAVRAALGAGRGRLVAGILVESLVLTAAATAAAVVLASGATKLLLTLAPPEIPRLDQVALDGRVLGFVALALVGATGLFAILPALRVTSWDLGQAVKTGGEDARGASSRVRSGLVIVELALAVVLLASAGLLARSFQRYLQWDPGFQRDGLLAVSAFMSTGKYPKRSDLVPVYRGVEAAVRAIPGVTSVASASAGPLFGGGDGEEPYVVEGQDPTAAPPSAAWFDIGPGYFHTLGLPLVEGREFTETDAAGTTPVAIVNQTLARRAWPDQDPVGRTVQLPEDGLTLQVVGVVSDVQPLTPGATPQPQIYWPNRQLGRWGTFFLVRTAGDPTALASAVKAAMESVDPDLSLGTPRTLVSQENRELVLPRFQALVLLFFALAALALSAVGVYAVVSYAVARRVREMGIRMALGARSADVVRLVLRSSMAVALTGIAVGLLGSYYVGHLIRGMVHGVSPTDPSSLLGAALILMTAAALAALLPARRATRADPLQALRAE